MRRTTRTARRRIMPRGKPTTVSALAMQAGPSIGETLPIETLPITGADKKQTARLRLMERRIIARVKALEDQVSRLSALNEERFDDLEILCRRVAHAGESTNDAVRNTLAQGPFSADALSKMFQRMDNQMTMMVQRLDTMSAQ